MKRPRKKTRSIASYRAASLKGARSRRQMLQYSRLAQDFAEYLRPHEVHGEIGGRKFILRRPRTIDLIPKVTWP